jgi:hypothetical protein
MEVNGFQAKSVFPTMVRGCWEKTMIVIDVGGRNGYYWRRLLL